MITGQLNRLINPSDQSVLLSLLITIGIGVIGGEFASRINYPPMLGMLVSGIILRNAFPFLIVDIPHSWTSKLWTLSLAAVISRAGLSLDLDILKKNAHVIMILGTIPILSETTWLAILSRSLFQLPKPWAYLLSFGVASISPGVVVPLILNLKENPEWNGSRLPPLMIASASIDVLVATIGFGISLNYAFKDFEILDQVSYSSMAIVALEEIFFGILLGAVFGFIAFL